MNRWFAEYLKAQKAAHDSIPLEQVARAAGYRRTARVNDATELREALGSWFDAPGPSMLLVAVDRANVAGIGRVEPAPPEITARFRAACTSS